MSSYILLANGLQRLFIVNKNNIPSLKTCSHFCQSGIWLHETVPDTTELQQDTLWKICKNVEKKECVARNTYIYLYIIPKYLVHFTVITRYAFYNVTLNNEENTDLYHMRR